jgi:hypothetical protein
MYVSTLIRYGAEWFLQYHTCSQSVNNSGNHCGSYSIAVSFNSCMYVCINAYIYIYIYMSELQYAKYSVKLTNVFPRLSDVHEGKPRKVGVIWLFTDLLCLGKISSNEPGEDIVSENLQSKNQNNHKVRKICTIIIATKGFPITVASALDPTSWCAQTCRKWTTFIPHDTRLSLTCTTPS